MSACKSKKVTFNTEKNEYFYIPKNIKKKPALVPGTNDFCQEKSSRGQTKIQGTILELENGKSIFVNHNGLFM